MQCSSTMSRAPNHAAHHQRVVDYVNPARASRAKAPVVAAAETIKPLTAAAGRSSWLRPQRSPWSAATTAGEEKRAQGHLRFPLSGSSRTI